MKETNPVDPLLLTRHQTLPLFLLLLFVTMVAFPSPAGSQVQDRENSRLRMANPASVNCEKLGGTLVIEKGADGGERGVCRFGDGTQCDEWALFRGECPVYVDPFLYCRTVGTADTPDNRYRGDGMPDAVVRAMVQHGMVSDDAPPGFRKKGVWRCMDHAVWACHFGANIPCTEKADLSRIPSPAMEAYCKANPGVDTIPAYVTGRATVYEWKCSAGRPEAARQVLRRDSRGFIADFWFQVTP